MVVARRVTELGDLSRQLASDSFLKWRDNAHGDEEMDKLKMIDGESGRMCGRASEPDVLSLLRIIPGRTLSSSGFGCSMATRALRLPPPGQQLAPFF